MQQQQHVNAQKPGYETEKK